MNNEYNVFPTTRSESHPESQLGGKGNNLRLLQRAGFRVPPAFVVPVSVFDRFLVDVGAEAEIAGMLERFDLGNLAELHLVEHEIKKLILRPPIPDWLNKDISLALKQSIYGSYAVRSSGTLEDSANASFAGQFDSYLDVKPMDVVKCVRRCWASGFNARAIAYRCRKNLPSFPRIAVVVQEWIQADFSGVIFTLDPIVAGALLIEIVVGPGEALVAGRVSPSSYRLKRWSGELIESKRVFPVPADLITSLTSLGQQVEETYGAPQDIEFVVKDGSVLLVQTRPITTTTQRGNGTTKCV